MRFTEHCQSLVLLVHVNECFPRPTWTPPLLLLPAAAVWIPSSHPPPPKPPAPTLPPSFLTLPSLGILIVFAVLTCMPSLAGNDAHTEGIPAADSTTGIEQGLI